MSGKNNNTNNKKSNLLKKLRMDFNEDAQEPTETKLYNGPATLHVPSVLSFRNIILSNCTTAQATQ